MRSHEQEQRARQEQAALREGMSNHASLRKVMRKQAALRQGRHEQEQAYEEQGRHALLPIYTKSKSKAGMPTKSKSKTGMQGRHASKSKYTKSKYTKSQAGMPRRRAACKRRARQARARARARARAEQLACSCLDEALLGAGMSKQAALRQGTSKDALRQVYEEQEQGMSWEQGKRVYQELFVY